MQTNKEFSQQDSEFKNACEKAGITPGAKQASKWRNKKGLGYLYYKMGGSLAVKEFLVKLTKVRGNY